MSASGKSRLASPAKQVQKKPIRAIAVSRGVAVGNIVCLHGNKHQFYRINLRDSQIPGEIRRLRAAVRLAKRQLKKLSSSKSDSLSSIFDTHHLILDDNSLTSKIETVVEEKKVNAEWAVNFVTDRYLSIYKDIPDEHLRERRIDIQDIRERLLGVLSRRERTRFHLDKNSIIAATEINPSTLVELSQENIKGIITERGGWTSHTFILARELNIPAVTGIKGLIRRVKTGGTAIIDGYNGDVFLDPSQALTDRYHAREDTFHGANQEPAELPKGTPKTLDGRKIIIRNNLDIARSYQLAKRFGAEGIGLFRSEFLFNQHQGLPSENEQYRAYQKVAELAGKHGAKIRTFDLSIDQINEKAATLEKNPAMGLRAIRLSLTHEKAFRAQIRALLRASYGQNLDIVLPMITDLSEIVSAKEIIEKEKDKLALRKIKYGAPKLGIMIEVPAAVMIVDELAREVDFMCLGTNDLVQYFLGVDRDNELVANWFRTLHPAILRSVKKVIDASDSANKPLIICGEMAGSPVYAAILVGLGATELSMNANSIPKVRHLISNIAFEEAREITKKLLECNTADQTEEFVSKNLSSKWKHLFPTVIFPQNIQNKAR